MQLPLSADSLLNVPCPGTSDCELMYRSRFVHRLSTYLSVIGYSLNVLRLLRPHLRQVKENYSAIEEVNLRWLKALDYAFLLSAAAGIAVELLGFFAPPREVTPGVVQAMGPLILSLLFGWFGLQQNRIQLGDASGERSAGEEVITDTADRKYQTSSLTDEGAAAIWRALQCTMANKQPHLEAGLKIADLARLLKVPVHHLSETINGFARQSFYEFINQHRIEEAARLLVDPALAHLSVTDIGLQAGFNSNSTFFSHFKQRLQQTPRQYRERQAQLVNG
ncbi:AraC family transcriptional regulator [Microbulbifer magnicolonia]|uniref:helix-turn-helix transcriptional regulator n=1 Tax=Microbulbifer magnicolonia TaxID=3109744 RepID=UPI002B41601D|nr:AraC family transcriptional regulator [Microbulbifer sp. GG15]